MIKLLHHQMQEKSNCSDHDCMETLKQVRLALDGELSAEEEIFLMTSLDDCSGCLDRYNIEKDFKIFLQKKIEKRCCTESLKESIKAIITKA
jgi:hypothetical protein